MEFKLKLKPLLLILVIFGTILGLSVIVINIVNFALATDKTGKEFTLIITVLVGVIAFLICLSTLISSKIVISGDDLIFKYGFLSNKFDIKSISKISILEKSHKIIITFLDENYFEANISQKSYDSFVKAITNANPNIVVDYTTG